MFAGLWGTTKPRARLLQNVERGSPRKRGHYCLGLPSWRKQLRWMRLIPTLRKIRLGCVLVGDMALMKSRLILRGLQYKEDKIRFFRREVLDEWASQGKSGSHFVFFV